MKFKIQINVMPLTELLDPQGKAVTESLRNLGMNGVQDVRIGKHITLDLEAANAEEAGRIAEEACKKLLANTVMESFDYTVHPA